MSKRTYKILAYTFLVLLFIIAFTPFYVMMINSTRTSQEIQAGISMIPGSNLLNNIRNFFAVEYIYPIRGLFNSLFISLSATVLMMYFSSLTAYAFEIYDFRFKKVLYSLMLFTIMVPGQLLLIGLYEIVFKFQMIDTYWPLIIPSIASVGAVIFIRMYVRQSVSRSLIESGRMDGLSEIKIFHGIALPIMRPAVFTMGIFHFIGTWNNYIGPLVFIQNSEKYTLPLMIAQLRGFAYEIDQGVQYFAILFSLIPILIIFIAFSKQIISGISAGSVKE